MASNRRSMQNHPPGHSAPSSASPVWEGHMRVGVLVWDRRMIRGILDYLQSQRPRPFVVELVAESVLRQLNRWPGHGLITMIESMAAMQAVRAWGRPVINISNKIAVPAIPNVLTNNLSVGQAAAEHLLNKGLRNLGVIDVPRFLYSVLRARGFEQALGPSRRECRWLHLPPDWQMARFRASHRRLAQWLCSLQRPAGVFTSHDSISLLTVQIAAEVGLRVPEDVAVLGVDNDELFCDGMEPPLSSVDTHLRRHGQEAAALMHRLLRGEAPPSEPILIPPLGVCERLSTDTMAVADPLVRQILHYFRQHLHELACVEQAMEHLPLSRRTVERRFHRVLGHSPFVELRRLRVAEAKRLLIQTNLNGDAIAAACGFSYRTRLHTLFRAFTGMTPQAYRRRFAQQ